MTNKIFYGDHLFPGNPALYVRSEDTGILTAHNEILTNLAQALNRDIKGSLAQQIGLRTTDTAHISFMNYGNTEMVYLLRTTENNNYTLLVNQPHTDKDVIRNQFQNLKRLHASDPRFVVQPSSYFETEKFGFYLTEYVDNALCIGNEMPEILGAWNPVPNYHFEDFNKETTDYVNIARIAHLVNTYDNEEQLGITKTEISGNDFMLTQETDLTNLQSIINNTRMISARNNMKIPFADYIKLVLDEFQQGTRRDYKEVLQGKIKINHQSIMPMTEEIIAEGILQGMLLKISNPTTQR